ncbi:SprT-like family-domain-containing protein [Mycena rebaudengoi]|nr:SprT-like family-domain-containing protein [Mycena rebaudengoi]
MEQQDDPHGRQSPVPQDRHLTQTAKIELALKVVDCPERIRNTLSHEMCHLAAWAISNDTRQSHGPVFKQWAARVERKDPDITVSVRHNYEIYYPFQWECVDCSKTYGRHSNSINLERDFCGNQACETGRLVPLFDTAKSKKVSQLSKTGKMEAASPRDSPRRRRSPSPICISSDEEEFDIPATRSANTIVVHDTDSESECDHEGRDRLIEDLISTLQGVTITHSCLLEI